MSQGVLEVLSGDSDWAMFYSHIRLMQDLLLLMGLEANFLEAWTQTQGLCTHS